jgi:hypothetical protein
MSGSWGHRAAIKVFVRDSGRGDGSGQELQEKKGSQLPSPKNFEKFCPKKDLCIA